MNNAFSLHSIPSAQSAPQGDAALLQRKQCHADPSAARESLSRHDSGRAGADTLSAHLSPAHPGVSITLQLLQRLNITPYQICICAKKYICVRVPVALPNYVYSYSTQRDATKFTSGNLPRFTKHFNQPQRNYCKHCTQEILLDIGCFLLSHVIQGQHL